MVYAVWKGGIFLLTHIALDDMVVIAAILWYDILIDKARKKYRKKRNAG